MLLTKKKVVTSTPTKVFHTLINFTYRQMYPRIYKHE